MEIVKTYIVMYKGAMLNSRPVKMHETKDGNYYIDEGRGLKSISIIESEKLLLLF